MQNYLRIVNIVNLSMSSIDDEYHKKKNIQKTTHRFNHYWGDKRQMNDICKPVIEYPEKIYYINLEELYILH